MTNNPDGIAKRIIEPLREEYSARLLDRAEREIADAIKQLQEELIEAQAERDALRDELENQ